MRLSTTQLLLLNQLNSMYKEYEHHHPKDAYNSRTVESLIKHKLVEKYNHRGFLNGALKLTDEGKRVLLNNGEI